MTETQFKKLKLKQIQNLHNGIRVEQLYPEVDRIVIHYEREHSSFAGVSSDKRAKVVLPQDEFTIVLPCLNKECTSIGFDLRGIISSGIHNHKSVLTGEMVCSGQEAPDHPEQSCDGTLKYTVKLYYKE